MGSRPSAVVLLSKEGPNAEASDADVSGAGAGTNEARAQDTRSLRLFPQSFGRYTLLAPIAAGGMAEVFLAELNGPMGFNRRLAVKRILPQFVNDTDFVHSFIDEAKVGAHLTHPHIVKTEDLTLVDGQPCLAMEYVEGGHFGYLIQRARQLQTPLPIPFVAAIVQQVARGLEHAHNARTASGRPLNLIHRDVKPSNLLLGFDGMAKLVDFGIARASGNLTQTMPAMVKGSLPYMSPEQATASRNLTGSTDLFSLGAVLFELLTLERLYRADHQGAMLAQVAAGPQKERLALLDALPPPAHSLVRITRRLLEPLPEHRFLSATELLFVMDSSGIPYPSQQVLGSMATEWLENVKLPTIPVRTDGAGQARLPAAATPVAAVSPVTPSPSPAVSSAAGAPGTPQIESLPPTPPAAESLADTTARHVRKRGTPGATPGDAPFVVEPTLTLQAPAVAGEGVMPGAPELERTASGATPVGGVNPPLEEAPLQAEVPVERVGSASLIVPEPASITLPASPTPVARPLSVPLEHESERELEEWRGKAPSPGPESPRAVLPAEHLPVSAPAKGAEPGMLTPRSEEGLSAKPALRERSPGMPPLGPLAMPPAPPRPKTSLRREMRIIGAALVVGLCLVAARAVYKATPGEEAVPGPASAPLTRAAPASAPVAPVGARPVSAAPASAPVTGAAPVGAAPVGEGKSTVSPAVTPAWVYVSSESTGEVKWRGQRVGAPPLRFRRPLADGPLTLEWHPEQGEVQVLAADPRDTDSVLFHFSTRAEDSRTATSTRDPLDVSVLGVPGSMHGGGGGG